MGAGRSGGAPSGAASPGTPLGSEGSADGCCPSNPAPRREHPLYLLTSHRLLFGPREARESPRLPTPGRAHSTFHRQRGEEGPHPGPPPCLQVGFAASPRHPAQLPAYLPEPRGEENGRKQPQT